MQTTTVDLEDRQKELLEEMAENGDIPNQSEGIRTGVEMVAAKNGYLNGQKKETTLRTVTGEMAKWFLIAGLVLVGVTYFYPVSLRLVALGPIISGLFLLGVERLLENHEPKVTNKIRGLFGGETA